MNVRDAKICLVCDEIFEGENCTRCGGNGEYLMKWVPPLYPRPEAHVSKMEKSDKVLTPFGNIEVVMNAEDSRVVTYQSARNNCWYHPAKVTPVFYSKNLKRFVSIPA